MDLLADAQHTGHRSGSGRDTHHAATTRTHTSSWIKARIQDPGLVATQIRTTYGLSTCMDTAISESSSINIDKANHS